MQLPDTVYKLTSQKLTTYRGFVYEVGKVYEFPGEGPLCSPGWSHAYLSPELAVLLNPIHAVFDDPRLFRCVARIGARDHDLKVGCSAICLVEELELPRITTEARVAFAIACAWEVTPHAVWRQWATAWLLGSDRTAAAAAAAGAWAAAEAVEEAAVAAAWAVEAVGEAAEAAAEAASGAAWAAEAAEEAWAASASLPRLASWAFRVDASKAVEPESWR